MKGGDLFSIEDQFTFYRHYHSNTANKRIHYVFVPILLVTALALLSRVPLSSPVDLAAVVCALYVVHAFIMDVKVGLVYTPVVLAYFGLSRYFVRVTAPAGNTAVLAAGLHAASWAAQFVGHFVFEKRAPALTQGVVQAVVAAPVVLWMDVVFSAGLMPDLKARLGRAGVVKKARKAAEVAGKRR